ncbi:MAG: hypothetical protein SFY67_14715 [Candidatus Melainabacteria bacterium]|nr:hypothetical protein [Candidatus Melainabacteria bacterium]
MSLIEAVFVVFLTGILSAAVLGTAALQNSANFRAYNKMGSLMAARRLESSLHREVHMARYFGDQFGDPQSTDTSNHPNVFPASNNPYNYTNFPTDTSNSSWPAHPYVLDEQTLILQVPVFVSGFATTKNGFWNVDTYVYKVLADKSQSGKGQFVLQKMIFPGDSSSNNIVSPVTVLTGIVGPINPNNAVDAVAGVPAPSVFSYFYKNSPTWSGSSSFSIPTATNTSGINGVGLTLELFSNESSNRKDYAPKTMAFKSEFFRRANGGTP